MSQKVKLQISSDLEDVARLSSVLLEESLLHINDLVGLINTAKNILKDINILDEQELEKFSNCLEILNTTRLPMNKIDNRLADIVAIIDGLNKVLNKNEEILSERKEEEKDDNISTR